MEGRKNDEGKARWDLLPFDALEEVVKVLTAGAVNYGDRNWEKGMSWSRLLAATFRHLAEFVKGRWTDSSSGSPALAHAACDVLFLLAYQLRGVGENDITPGVTAQSVPVPVKERRGPQPQVVIDLLPWSSLLIEAYKDRRTSPKS